ncbi:MAG TPA: trypsin-like serine protease [Vicinamibacterales bacterium]|jgi:secreted trypsin-like serine protease
MTQWLLLALGAFAVWSIPSRATWPQQPVTLFAKVQTPGQPASITGQDRDQEIRRLYTVLKSPQNLYPASVAIAASRGIGWYCNGVVIRPAWVITTAHCVDRESAAGLSVLYGAADLTQAKRVDVTQIVLRSTAKPALGEDIALLKLAHEIDVLPIELSRRDAEPVTRPKGDSDPIGRSVVAGWGQLIDRVAMADSTQRHLAVRVIGSAECNARWSNVPGDRVGLGEFCATSAFPLVDVCAGYSGAGLMAPDESGRLRLEGIVSRGLDACTSPRGSTVYVDVVHHARWIEATTGSKSFAARDVYKLTSPLLDPFAGTATATARGEGRILSPDFSVAPTGLFRYAVSLSQIKGHPTLSHFCGGVLMSRDWVLTAGHCVAAIKDQPQLVRLKVDTEKLSFGGVTLQAKQIFVHDKFHRTPSGNYVNDIALIRIAGSVPQDIVFPRMVSADQETTLTSDPATTGFVIGWGRNSSSRFGQASDFLHWTTVKLVDRATCNGDGFYTGLIDENVICAGSEGVDACQGDSGGPLFLLDSRADLLIAGLVSWGDDCGKPNRPGVYVRTSAYDDWLRTTVLKAPPK